jgi:hypothetical protein
MRTGTETLAVLACVLVLGCSSLPDARTSAALGVAAADHALDFVARNVRADDAAGHARVERVRVALEITAEYVNGKAPALEGLAALADALRVAELAVTELEADGVKVPREIKAALSGARVLASE